MPFESLTDERIETLLRMPKRITNPTARKVQDANHDKMDYVLESDDGSERFKLFVRQSKSVSDDFSCGLIWLPAGGESLILARYNGSSHEHPNHLEQTKISFACHVHQATERYIQASLKAESFAAETSAYQTCNGALHELTVNCNITGIQTVADHPELRLESDGRNLDATDEIT